MKNYQYNAEDMAKAFVELHKAIKKYGYSIMNQIYNRERYLMKDQSIIAENMEFMD